MTATKRNSSVELLRILLMVFIVIHHIISSVVAPNFSNRIYACVDVFLHTAVIVFVLITGYFGLRFNLRKALLLLFQVLFYSALLGCIAYFCFGIGTRIELVKSFLPISSNAYWFITVYFQLFFLAPFITKMIEQLTDRQYSQLLIVLFVLVCWFGFLWKDSVSVDGKNIVNFTFIYLLGNGIRRVERNKPSSVLISRKWALLIISFLVLCLVGFYFLPDRHNLFIHAIVFSYKYNSPFLILLSIALFNVFRTFSFDTRFINYMATSSLSIYLIHEHPLMREIIYVRPFNKLMLVESGFSLFLIIVGYALVLSFCCMVGDKIRQYVFEKISNRSDR